MNIILTYLALTATAYAATLILTPLVREAVLRIGAVDAPDKRKMHQVPMPRLGGVSIALAIAFSILAALGVQYVAPGIISLSVRPWMPIIWGGLIVFLAGVWDDLRPLPASVKLLFELAAAAIAVWFMGPIREISMIGGHVIDLGVFALPLTYLWIIGITNAFNLIDGLDGLAAGLAGIAAGTSAAIFALHGNAQDAMLMTMLLGGLLGFLHYNFNPARIFLGDSGSLLVGYLLAVGAMSGSQRSATTLAVITPFLIFGLPIFETFLSLVRRFSAGVAVRPAGKNRMSTVIHAAKSIFKPDSRHIHHRLLVIGFSHPRAVLVMYAISLWLSFMALLSVMSEYRNAGVILVMVGLATYIGLRKLGYHEISFGKITTLLSWYEQAAFNGIFYVAFLDIILLGVSYWGTFLLKYDVPQTVSTNAWYTHAFPAVLAIQFFAFYACGLYKRVCGSANVADVMRMVSAVAAGGALSYVVCQLSLPPAGNLAFFCIDALLLSGLVACSRNINSILEYTKTVRLHDRRGGLIYGAGRSEQFLVQALSQEATLKIRPIGYLDENPLLQERRINDLPVLGSYKDLASILAAHPISTLIFSSDRIIDEQLRTAITFCKQQHILVLRAGLELEAVDSVSLPLPSSFWAEEKARKQAA